MENPSAFGNNYQVIGTLGEGSFSKVYKLKNTKTGQIYAVKKLKKRFKSLDEANRNPEISVLRVIQGKPNIVKLEDILFDSDNGNLALLFECLDINLYELIESHKKPYDEKTALILVYQLLKAISVMHNNCMFHRDIKPENCMVDRQTLELKLVDFGSTRQTQARGPFTEYVSTRWYRAPECILTAGSYGPAVDIWAVGCILYEIMTSRPLFPGKHELDQICRIHNQLGTPSRAVLQQFSQNPNKQINFSFPPRCSQDFRSLLPFAHQNVIDLLTQLLTYNPVDRITVDEALEHPAFEQMRHDEERWRLGGSIGPLSYFLVHGTPLHNVVVTLPVKMPGKTSYQWAKQEVAAPPSDARSQSQKQNTTEYTVQNIINNKEGKDLVDSRKAAAERIRAFNQKNIIPKKREQRPPAHSVALGHAKIYKRQLVNPPQMIVGCAFMKPRPEIVQPRLPRLV